MPQSFDVAARIVKDDLVAKAGSRHAFELEDVAGALSGQQKNNLSRLRQRFQQVASKAIPAQISNKLVTGGSNWAQFTNTIRRTLDDSKDSLDDSEFAQNLDQAIHTIESVEQLVEVNLDDSSDFACLNACSTLDHHVDAPHCQAVRKTESEPDLVSYKNDVEELVMLHDKADSKVSSLSSLTFPMQLRPGQKPVLALDLDETLIHSSLVPRRPADFWIEVIQNGDMRTREVFWVYKRPGVDEFLRAVAQHYTVLIFTAGIKEYAAQILDELDPENKIFAGRLYRDSCTETRGMHPSLFSTTAPPSAYTKDMTRVCDDMSRVLLVDNTPGCFALQPSNGLPIRSWYADPSDRQLARLQDFLCDIRHVDDLRLVLPEWRM